MSGEVYSEGAAPYSRNLAGNSAEFLSGAALRAETGVAVLWRQILLGIVLVEIPLQIDVYLFHSKADAQLGAISGFNISLTTICLFFLYLQWLPRQIVSSAPIRFSKSLAVYLAIVACSTLWAADSSRALFDLFLQFQAVLIFIYFVNNTKTRTDVIFAMTFLAIGLIIEGSLTLAVRVIGHEISLGPIAFGFSEIDHRVQGSFGSPNVAASYIAILLAPCLSLLFIPGSKFLKLLAIAAIVSGGAALILTMSRGGWLAAAFSLATFVIVGYGKGWLSGAKFAVLILGAMIFAAGFLPILASRLFGDDAGSAASRIPLNEISGMMIVDHPLGVGANNWELAARRYSGQREFRGAWFYTVHNHYLLVLCELGWLGFLAYMAFLASIVRCGWLALKRSDRSVAPLLLGLTAAFAGQLIHMPFDIFNSRSQIQMICLVAALIVVSANLGAMPVAENDSIDTSPSLGNQSAGFSS